MWKRVLFGALLAGFVIQTARALIAHGYAGFFVVAQANPATRLMLLDLVLALGLVVAWMVRDARRRGGSYLPASAVTLLFGVAGPLVYLLARGWGRGRERSAALALLALLVAAAAGLGNHADLRPPAVEAGSAARAARGRALLAAMAERHGLAAWRRHETMELTVTDSWRRGGWWPAPAQRLRSRALLGTFTSRVELLDGPGAGEVRGLQSWTPYRQAPGTPAPVFVDEPAPEITFYLPTLQYFTELPFRLPAADVVLDAGPASYRGRDYERVFVTWDEAAPHAGADQYLLWIDAETGRLAMAQYTVRDLVAMSPPALYTLTRPLARGTIHYDDYREIQGVLVPFVQTLTLPEPVLTEHPVSEHNLHRLVVESASFDGFPAADLLPAHGLPEPADRKPAA